MFMAASPELRVVKVDCGFFREAPSLNPQFAADTPLLLVTLDIRWDRQDIRSAVAHMEEALLAFLPSFAKHQCRGEQAYQVFAGRGSHAVPRPAVAGVAGATPETLKRYDGCLAFAHLVEHCTLEFQSAVTGEKRCSGVTAAYRNTPGRFDVMVECRERRAGQCCLALAVAWLTSVAEGKALGSGERDVLAAGRLVHSSPGRGFTPPAMARALGWSEARAQAALSALRDVGYLEDARYTMNFSGVPEYRLSGP